jgi:hypothetical protein
MTCETLFKQAAPILAALFLLIAVAFVVAAQPTASIPLPTSDSGVDPVTDPTFGNWRKRAPNGGNPEIGFHLDGELSTPQEGIQRATESSVWDGVEFGTSTITDAPNAPWFGVEASFNMSGYVQVADHQHWTHGYKVRSECMLVVGRRVPGEAWIEATVKKHREKIQNFIGKEEYTHESTYSDKFAGDELQFRIVILGEVTLETSRADMWIRGEAKSAGDTDSPSLEGTVKAYDYDGQTFTDITNGTPSQPFGP